MANKKEVEPLLKITLNVFKSDYEALADIYGVIGPQKAIRTIIRQHLLKVKEELKDVA